MTTFLFKELTYTGYKVFMFLWTFKSQEDKWSAIEFSKWLGVTYDAGASMWTSGVSNVVEAGYLKRQGRAILWNKVKLQELIKKAQDRKKREEQG